MNASGTAESRGSFAQLREKSCYCRGKRVEISLPAFACTLPLDPGHDGPLPRIGGARCPFGEGKRCGGARLAAKGDTHRHSLSTCRAYRSALNSRMLMVSPK